MTYQTQITDSVFQNIRNILENARAQVYRSVNFIMVEAYWNIGRIIVDEEQKGKRRAEFGQRLIAELSKKLSAEFGSGFDPSNLRYMRLFFFRFPICDAVRHKFAKENDLTSPALSELHEILRPELTWTHYRLLLRVENPDARSFYINEAANSRWSTRELDQQINSLLFERLSLSKDKSGVMALASKGQTIQSSSDLIKDPYVLDFLGLEHHEKIIEKDLEQALIDHIQSFLLELGKGFSFVARQQRITLDGDHFYIDLVFYNRLARCFVLIDLKVGKITHQDIGQMQMYVNYFQRTQKSEEENDPIGIILCAEKNDAVIRFTLPEDQKQIFISKYFRYFPSEEELRNEILRQKESFEMEHKLKQASA
ncbi:MAG: PDDEXK nuclease domain-containing protein [Candidatus Neomarinimicrobiota bacterium]